jgi:hypothetical protein
VHVYMKELFECNRYIIATFTIFLSTIPRLFMHLLGIWSRFPKKLVSRFRNEIKGAINFNIHHVLVGYSIASPQPGNSNSLACER